VSNDASIGAYGNFIRGKIGSGSPKKAPLIMHPPIESFSKNSPLKKSEEFKGQPITMNKNSGGGITSEMSVAAPTQTSGLTGISLNKDGSNN
jgi:hypothetical protein